METTKIKYMKKKWELLKYAYDNYPKDTVIDWGSGKIKLTGAYHFIDCEAIIDENGACVQDSTGDWALIVSKPKQDGEMTIRDTTSILSGKCAIQVNNEREFKLLMEHYESKGWKDYGGGSAKNFTYAYDHVTYGENFFNNTDHNFNRSAYKIIPFADFAREANIKVPVKIMVSEDGVDLFEGDEYCATWFGKGVWSLNGYYKMAPNTTPVTHPNESKAFSTKDAAEKWIEEQNKPKEIMINLFNKYHSAIIRDKEVDITVSGRFIRVTHSDIEEIQRAIDQLNKK